MLADWLIDHVPALRRAVQRRVDTAGAHGPVYMEGVGWVSPLTAAFMPPSAGLAGGQTDSGADAERRAKRAARVAEAMEKDAAAKWARRPATPPTMPDAQADDILHQMGGEEWPPPDAAPVLLTDPEVAAFWKTDPPITRESDRPKALALSDWAARMQAGSTGRLMATDQMGHEWERDQDGEIDFMAYDADPEPHNGPRCVRCGYGFCHHCQSGPSEPCDGEGGDE